MTKKADTPQPKFKTNVEKLFAEFKSDDKQATAKYNGEWIEVEGLVLSAPAPLGDLVLIQEPLKHEPSARCRMSTGFHEKMKWLGRGQLISVTGRFTSLSGDRAYLEDCEFKELQPNPTQKISAKALASAYAKDSEAATATYRGKELLVEGMVQEIESESFNNVKLESISPVTILITLGADDRQRLSKGTAVLFKVSGNTYRDQKLFLENALLLEKK